MLALVSIELISVPEINSTPSTGGLGLAKSSPLFFNNEQEPRQVSFKAMRSKKLVERRDHKIGKNMNIEQTNEPSCSPFVGQTNASLVVNKQVIPLFKEVTRLGRHLENDVVIHEEFLSRYHAEIIFEAGNYVLYDKNSTGGTYVNGRKIDRCLLNSGDLISLVNIQIMFVNNTSGLVSKSNVMTQGLGGFRNDR